jgi:hypothetical protein
MVHVLFFFFDFFFQLDMLSESSSTE